ncbi:SCC2 [Candida margitis]|uniref:SCC2 n=1 Tax=Candida margitis TaxID=1775924 RepID=UPI002227CA7B|nr:SCC2 [Candida margitis]KAI5964993.1 SCC2 [Candida margitis]
MSTHESQSPESLKQVLATTPLLHLIPKQNLSPLINLPSLVPRSDETVLNKHIIDSIESFDTEHSRRFERECQEELLAFSDPELDSIKFKVLASHHQDNAPPREYSHFETQILNNESIDDSKLAAKSGDELVKTGRLSIRKRAPTDDATYVPKHNQKYFRKFDKEYMRSNPTQEEISPNVSENDMTPIVSIPQNPAENLNKFNFGKFSQFIRNEQRQFTWEDMAVMCETLNKIDTFQDQDAKDLVKVLEICFKTLSEALSKLQNKTISEFDDIKSILPDLLCGTFASKASIIIIKYKISKGVKMAFSKYTLVMTQTLEYVFENFLLPSEKLISGDADDFTQNSFHKLITETSTRLKQLASLSSSSSFEEQTLTKLEMLCVDIIFNSKINEAETLQSLLPIDALQTSAGFCLIAIYQNSIDQRTFLLHEVLTGFPLINTKKGTTKKFKTKRGIDIHLFTMILNNFSYYFVESEGYSSDFMDHVSRELIKKVQGNPAELRPKLTAFINDLVQLLYLPEWPAADLFLASISSCLIQVLNSPEEQISGETQLLDILQDLAERVLGYSLDDVPMGEKEMMVVLGNCREFEICDALQFLQTKIHIRTGFTLEAEPTKNSDTISPGYKWLVLTHLVNFFTSKYFTFLEEQVGSSRAKTRAKAIKGLLIFVTKSPQLLLSAHLQKQLSSRLQDPAASVRDSMHEFLNTHISKNPDEAQKLIHPMYLALNDPSISVRKRSIQSCLAVFPLVSEVVKLRISERVLEKIHDEEDSVRNEAVSGLKSLFLFQPPKPNLINPGALDVIRIAKSKGSKLLSAFFNEYVFTDSKSVGFVDTLVLTCIELVGSAVDAEGGMLLLSILCQLKPSLITQDTLVEMKSFFIDEANINTSAYTYALQILQTTTSHLIAIRPELSIEIQTFLLSKIINFHQRDMLTATSSLWNLSRLSSTEGKIANAISGTLKWVRKSYNDRAYRQLPKLVQLLGCFARIVNLEQFHNVFVKEGFMNEQDGVMSMLFKHILTFTKPEYPPTLRKYALSNLVLASSCHPKFIAHSAVTSRVLNAIKTEPADVKCAIIQNLNIYLDDHGSAESKSSICSDNLKSIQGIANMQQNACKFLVDHYFDEIIKLCATNDIQLVLESFLFMRMSLEMGFANPIGGISTVVALQGSPTLTLQKAAHDLHKYLFEKYKPVVDSQYTEGIKLAFSTGQIAKNMFVLLYDVAVESRMSRNKFIKALSRFFVIKSKRSHLAEDLKFIIFVIERMSLIKYKTIEEVYIILDQLQQVLQNIAPDYIHDLRESQIGDENTSHLAHLIYLFLDFYNYLSRKYNISSENIEGFGSRCLEIDFTQTPTIVSSPTLHVGWVFANMLNIDSLKFVVKEIRKSIFVQGE